MATMQDIRAGRNIVQGRLLHATYETKGWPVSILWPPEASPLQAGVGGWKRKRGGGLGRLRWLRCQFIEYTKLGRIADGRTMRPRESLL